jgi:hypothetical protein
MVSEARNANFFTAYYPARAAFRELTRTAGGQLETIPLDATGPDGDKLTVDIAWLGADSARHVVLHSAGLHGVEGFAGSAIQIQTLRELPAIPGDTALVLVHILNPHGMSWIRRVNEHNVDLNRNALYGESYTGAPKAYSELDGFLNPPSPPASDLFLIKAGWLVLRHGMPTLRQAVAGGQYEFPRGLFFGGKQLEQSLDRYHSFLARRLRSAERVVAIDVHSGLGKYGGDTLVSDPKSIEKLSKVFGRKITSSEPDEGPAYRIRGGLESLVSAALPNAEVLFVTQEFGTYGPVRNLHALREENRWHHFGGGGLDHPAKRALMEAFNPNDNNWRESVLRRGSETLERAVESVRGQIHWE